LWQPERLHRLILAGAIAYFFTTVLGVEAIISGAFKQLVRTDAFYHSLFQLGLIYLDHLLNQCLAFPSLIDLPPPDVRLGQFNTQRNRRHRVSCYVKGASEAGAAGLKPMEGRFGGLRGVKGRE
jgi:hypothetical protein